MKLNVQDRLTLVNLVPEKGNFETMSTVEALKLILYPSEDEVKTMGITQTLNKISWNILGTEPIEVPLSDSQIKILLLELEKCSAREELTVNQYSILKKFRENKT